MNYDEIFKFVEQKLIENDGLFSKKFSFRNRFEHIVRVFKWCERLLTQDIECDRDVVLTAAAFHDVGYHSQLSDEHAEASAIIFREYASSHGFDPEFTLNVEYTISRHSDKQILKDRDTPIELVILMEADLLDEEGAMGIAWDLMADSRNMPTSYDSSIAYINKHAAHILNQDYMVTPLAKEIWEHKKEVVRSFLAELRYDLFKDGE